MTIIIGGHGLGLQDGSLGLLNRNALTSEGTLDQRMQAYVSVSGGNLVVQERDVFLPSRGEDFTLLRTYNSRGAIGGATDGWSYSTAITLSTHQDKPADNGPSVNAYVVTYGDGSVAHFDFDASRNLWVSTDGAGAYETLAVLAQIAPDGTKYRLTRADQSQYNFDKDFVFRSMVDTNGVRTEFTYQGGRVQTVSDDTGHLITYQYDGIGKLASIVDELGTRLVSYTYSQGQLSTVTDRFGHVTTYSYNANGLLSKISLPFQQTVNGQLQSFEQREIQFAYQSINWDDHPHFVTPFDSGSQWALTSITDPLGGVTSFENTFIFNTTAVQPGDRDLAYKQVGGRYFAGGTTRVVDAMGNGLATSNAAEFQQKRVALGFAADVNALTQAQKDALRQQFSLSYTFDPDGYITQVVDQQGFRTTYTYGGKTAADAQSAVNQDNLLSVTDRNGWGATNSDSAYFRALRKDLGVVDAAGNGKLVANLTAAEKTALLAKFTTTFTYDARGNLLTSTDGLGNQTSYTYTTFNKVATMTAAMGNALATLDHLSPGDNFYRNKRVELGFPDVAAASLTDTQRAGLRTLYTTTYSYDAKQNLVAQIDPGGDRTEFEYDAFGNTTKRTVVYRDAANVAVPAKNQVTSFAYDVFGNNTSMVDAEGKTTTMTFDHFGNLLTRVDGRGGVTTFTYDADNRLLTVTDPEGLITRYAYDAVGNRISTTFANGHTITQLFDRNNMLIATIDPGAIAALTRNTTFQYDILGNRTQVTDAEGRKATYSFDARRQLVDVETPPVLNGAEALVSYHTTYAYDGESNLVTFTDNNGNVTQSLYTANGLLKRETDPIGNVTEFLYDANLMQVQITIGAQLAQPLRRVLKFGFDEENQATSTTDPLGGIERQSYDAPGNIVSITDPNGNKTDFEYDRNNRMVREIRPEVIDPLSGNPIRYVVLHAYDANGNEVSTTDENGNVTTFTFDKDNRMVMVEDGNHIKTVFTWDARANRTQIAIGVDAHPDAAGKVVIDSVEQAAVTSFVYDEFNQLISTTDAVGNALAASDLPVYQSLRTELGFAPLVANLSDADKTTLRNRFTERYEYDRVGNQTKMTDHLGRVTSMGYDALDRLQSSTEALGTPLERTEAFRYDGNANLVKHTDAMGRITRATFDGNDRLVDVTDPLGVVMHQEYDNVGNVVSLTDAFGTPEARTSTYIYDLNTRLTQETDPEGHVKQYEYDAVGNRLKVIDARGGVTQYVYDALNRNIRIIDPLTFETRYEYDGVGNTITIVDANGGIERMQYDGTHRYIQTTDPMGRVLRLEYDRLDNVIKQTTAFGLPEAEVTSFVYDAEGNLRQVTDAAGKVSTQRFDDVYNLTSVTDNNGHTTTTAFDALNRQIRVTDALGGITTYTYDLEHNLLTETDPLGRTRSFQYDDRDQMITATDALGTLTTYAYDAVGNQVRITRWANGGTEARTTTFVYDKDDQLIRQVDPLGHATSFAYDANHNVVSTTDALGRITTYTFDAANRTTTITDPLGHVTQYKYDGKGNRTQVIDARGNAVTAFYNRNDEVVLTVDGEGNAVANSYDGNGNRIRITEYMTPLAGVINPDLPPPLPTSTTADRITTYAYDELNRLVARTDALGGEFTMAYDAVGNKVSETDENGHTTTFVYDVLDRLTSQTDPLGGVRSKTYDAVGNELSMTDENGHTTSYEYDANDRLIQQTDPLDGVRRFTHDAVGNQLTDTDENGHTTSYAYDLDDRLIEQTDPLGGVRTRAYDAADNVVSMTDENGHTTTYAYDADDRLIEQTDPLGGVRTRTYDAADNVASMTDENGHTTTYAYDKLNRLVTETDPLDGVKSIVYDAVSNQIRTTDANGHATRFEYDKNDRLVRRIDALNGERLFAYDAVGNQIRITDENGHATSYVYDANDRLIEQTDPLGGKTKLAYDAVGNQLSMIDENGHTTSLAYDANDRLIEQTDPLGGKRAFTYDAVGNRLSMTDENSHKTSFVYDANDRLTQQTDPLLGLRKFTYDAAGNQLSVTDENGHATSYVYDAKDRLIEQTDPLGGKRKFTYDGASNQLTATDQNGDTVAFAYDANDRLIERTDALGGKTKFSYDAVGNQLTETDENGHTTTSVYDARDRLIEQTDPVGGKRTFTYDAASNHLATTDQNGHTIFFAYDANDRVTKRTDALGGENLFTYDAVGNRTSMTDENGHATQFEYDENDRVVKRIDALGGERAFTYDAVGNQLSETDENGRVTVSVYDANDRLTEQTDPLGGKRLFAYDAVGNQLSMTDENGHTTSFIYDDNNRLIQRTDALGGERLFTYDAVGNRLSMTDENGHTTRFVYDANDRRITRTDALGNSQHSTYDAVGNLLSETDENGHATEYFYDANDRLIRTTDALGGVMTLAYDGVGNKVSEIDENGDATAFTYDANNRKLTETDALGKTESCIYDAAGNRTSETDKNGHTTTFTYDALNRVTRIVDPLGFASSTRYDAVGNTLETRQQLSLADPSQEQVFRHAYDALDRRVSSLSAEGFLTLFEYDAVGLLVKTTAFDNRFAPTPAGEAPLTGSGPSRITLASYDANNRMVSETSPLGFVTRHEYDAVGDRTAMVEAHGTAEARRTEMTYDANNRLIETVDALGIVTRMVLDAVGNTLELHAAFGTPEVRVTQSQYDAIDRVVSRTDPLGVVTEFAYDGVGNLLEQRRAVGLAEARTEHFEYDANRRMTAEINGEGERTEYAYDGVGNRTLLIVAKGLPEQRINRFRYDGENRLIGETDGNGVETQYEYDGAGNKVKSIQLAAVYDSSGNSTGTYQGQSIAGLQRETLFAYDLDNRLTQVTDPMGGVTQYVVDALGNRSRITDANATQTVNTFDAAGRMLTNWVQGADHGGVLVTNSYDAFGNIVQTRRGFHDGSDTRQTTYTYDQRDRQTTITEYHKVDSLNAATVFSQAYSSVFEYDAFDNQTKIAQGLYLLAAGDPGYDAAKAALAHPLVATFTYDGHDKLLTSTDGVGNVLAYQNDAYGNRISQTTGAGTSDARTVSFGYDKADRTVRQDTGVGGVIKLAYDEAGNEVRRETLQSGTEATGVWITETHAYDGNGRIVSTTDGLGVITTNVLDAFGNTIETRRAAGTADERVLKSEYNKNNDLTATIDALGNRTEYEVDRLGNRISETDALNHVTRLYYNELNQQIGELDPEGYFTRMTRDSAGNLLTIQVYLQQYVAPPDGRTPPTTSPADVPRTTTNEFDGAGNRIRKTDPDQRVTEFVFDSAGKLLQSTDFGSSDAAALALTYNKAPRVQTFGYDAAGRLTRFTNADGVVETYAYDSANNRISETITNPNALAGGRTDPVRTTLFQFDAVNRQTSQIFDPAGLNQVQSLAYDKAGNVVAKTDALGHTTTLTYDLGNRMLSITDPLNNVTRFTYDRVGNRTSVEDARGQITNFEYDLDNRVTKEISPPVDVFTIRDGPQSGVRPTNLLFYDAVGNLVQTIDPNGNKTTRYYDANHNLVAELNGDNVLREFTVDAANARTSTTLYMTRLAPSAHDPAVRPGTPAGERRTITAEYDAMSRLVRTVYPSVDITTLSGVDTDSPTATTANVTPEQRHFYDAFGNLVESVNLAGNHTFAYFDVRGRVVATVDSAGYLIESDYDDQGNLVQQRKYEQPLVGVSAGTKPTPAGAPIAVVDRVFDAANRLVEELSPEVELDAAPRERVLTRFTYDAVGNQISKTLAAETVEASTEYSYYDAAGRRVALVNSGRTLHVFGYDANGNQTSLKRFITPVPGAIDLSTATLAQVIASVASVATGDQETVFSFDALNRQVTQTDLMSPGSADDIVVSTQYDAVGNVTRRTDAEGFASSVAYDALKHATQTISPDGSSSFVEYDAAGLKVRAWTGDLGSVQAQPATNLTASVSGGLSVSWSAPPGAVQSYVVYDTAAHDTPAQYANQTARQGGGEATGEIDLESFPAGTVLFFRVVTVDAAGSIAWTQEQTLTVPVRLTRLEVGSSASDLVITARFDGGITNPLLHFGLAGSGLGNQVAFVLQGDGSYRATITNPANGGQGLAYQLQWDFGGATFTTNAIPVDSAGEHAAVGTTLTFAVPQGATGTDAPNGQFVIVNGVRVDDAFQVNGTLQFDPKLTVAGTTTYHVYYGDLASTEHTVEVSFEDHQSTFVVSDTGPGGARTLVLGWQHDGLHTHIKATLSADEAARVGAGGVHAQVKAANATDVFTTDVALTSSAAGIYDGVISNLSAGAYDLQVYYTDTDGRKVIVEWRRINVPAQAALPANVTVVDNTSPFVFDGQSVTSGGVTDPTFPFNLSRAVAVGTAASFTGRSVTIFGTERNGTITRAADGTLSVTPGVYAGAVDVSTISFGVPSSATASAGPGSLKQDGLSAGTYFNEFEYNALGRVIATNEGSGLWRRFGVDTQGNAVETRVYGTRADEIAGRTPIVTFAAFDTRNLKIADFAAATPVAGLSGLHRAVTRGTFDYAGRLVSRLDPAPGALAQLFRYDPAGNLISETDALGNVTTMAYDRRGNEVRRTDPLGRVRRKEYDAADRLVQELDALGNPTQFAYDAFDRQTQVTDTLSHSTQMVYDQHDRLVQVTDPMGQTFRYTYDKRDNRIWTEDANHHFFGHAYDAMGRVVHAYSFQQLTPFPLTVLFPTPSTLAQAVEAVNNPGSPFRITLVDESVAYDAYGNKIAETDADKRSRFFTYGAFGRLVSQTDESRRVTTYTYDRFGRLTQETRPKDPTVSAAKNITRSYDDAGRVTQVNDTPTATTTTYTYDVAGDRKTETIAARNFAGVLVTLRNISYGYDGSGRMLSWSDAVTAKNLSYEYDAAGNQQRVSGSDGVDHRYSYDANDRVTQILQGASTVLAAYSYDADGRRTTFDDGTSTATYTYDADDRVIRADITPKGTPANPSDDTHMTWLYDAVGNVTLYKELAADNTTVKFSESHVYAANNRILSVATNDQRDPDNKNIVSTQNTLDKSGRVLVEAQTNSSNPDEVREIRYTHKYAADGRELSITATGTGDVTGSTTSTFDADDHLVRLDLGQGDGQDSAEFKRFIYSSDGQILARFHDDGKNETNDDGNIAFRNTTTQFLYANGNPVGQTGIRPDGTTETLLDIKQYTPVQNLGADLPGPAVTMYEVQAGDTFQSIAARVYANPSLWFVIAEANGFSGSEELKAGTRLMIPNTIESGRLTADTHNVYRESDIIGSKLPNLKSPPPNICAIIGAIILAIVIAIIAVIITIATAGVGAEIGAALIAGELPTTAAIIAGATAGLAGAGAVIGAETVSGAALAAGIVGGVIGGAIGGAVIGFAASALTQGIQIAFGLQKKFDWKQVAADVGGFALGGVGGALSAGAEVAARVAQLTINTVRLARVAAAAADTALSVAGEAISQVTVHDGHLEQPWMLAVAGGAVIGIEVLGALGSRAFKSSKKAEKIIDDAAVANQPQADPDKVVRSAEAESVASKKVDDISVESDTPSVAANLKAADTQLKRNDDGSASLQLTIASDSVLTKRNSAVEPETPDHTAAPTLSGVKNQNDLDRTADREAVIQANNLRAGQIAEFDDKTVTDAARKLEGKDVDNEVPISTVAVQQKPGSTPDQMARAEKLGTQAAMLEEKNTIDAPDLLDYNDVITTRTTSIGEPQPLVLPSRLREQAVPDVVPTQVRKASRDTVLADDLVLSISQPMKAKQIAVEADDLPLNRKAQVEASTIGVRIEPGNSKSQKRYVEQATADLAPSPEARAKQFAGLRKNLGKTKSGWFVDKELKQRAKLESKLLKDTINDKAIMTSPDVSSPAHALELKRLGIQPSAAGRVGHFTDARLDADGMTKLGSGSFNTVYTGKYTLPGEKDPYKGVFKPEVRGWGDKEPDVTGFLGIEATDIRAGYRSVATTRLDELLDFGGLTTRTEMAIHNQKLGTVSERARGVSPQKMMLGSQVDDHVEVYLKQNPNIRSEDVVERWNADPSSKFKIGMTTGDGDRHYHSIDPGMHEINYGHPRLRRDLVRLQLMDAVAGQLDRHAGNYFVKQDLDGNVIGVKGIDNDLSWGQKLTDVVKRGHLPRHLPPVVDKQAFDSIMALDPQALERRMGGLLTQAEIDAAKTRLAKVQNHLGKLRDDGRVLSTLEDWSSDGVTRLLLEQVDEGRGMGRSVTNYVARDLEEQRSLRKLGMVIPYPRKL